MDGFDIPIGRTGSARSEIPAVTLGPDLEIHLRTVTPGKVVVNLSAPWGANVSEQVARPFLGDLTDLWAGLAFSDASSPSERRLLAWNLRREGLCVQVCPGGHLKGRDGTFAPTDDLLRGLRKVGDLVAACLPVADPATAAWRNRSPATLGDLAALDARLLGLPQPEFRRQGFRPVTQVEDLIYPDDIRMVARSAASRLDPFELRLLLDAIRTSPARDVPQLDGMADRIRPVLSEARKEKSFDQGHTCALGLRQILGIGIDQQVDITGILGDLGVEIKRVSVKTWEVDAVAAWGSYGPVIVVNPDGRHANSPAGERTTLAHELCHLLVDRDGGLPVADIRWSSEQAAKPRWEQRANAFAAEFLLPREAAARELVRLDSVGGAMRSLSSRYGVSTHVVLHQLDNQPEGSITIGKDHQEEIRQRLVRLTNTRGREARRRKRKSSPSRG